MSDQPRAHLVLDPETLCLPAAARGTPSVAPLTLLNLGDLALELHTLQIDGGFSVEGCGVGVLQPSEACTLTIHHQQDATARTGHLLIASTDLERPNLVVELVAPGSFPWLVVSPTQVDFGPTPSGVTSTHRVTVTNLGQATARPSLRWILAAADFSASLPWTELAPGGSADLELSYTPRGGDADRATLELGWPGGSRRLELSGYQDLKPPR